MEIAQKQQTCKIQDALKKRYASTLCACMIHAAKCSGAVINTAAGNHDKPVTYAVLKFFTQALRKQHRFFTMNRYTLINLYFRHNLRRWAHIMISGYKTKFPYECC